MSVRFFYVDESYDAERFCLSALSIPHRDWREAFQAIVDHRRELKKEHGLFIRKEIHARDFVSGRGEIASQTIGKWRRSRLYLGLLQLIARLPGASLMNVCLNVKRHEDPQMDAWNRLINRIERTMQEFENREIPKRKQWVADMRPHLSEADVDAIEERLNAYRARAVIISDEGREHEITRALRKMRVYNPIPSQFGAWSPGESSKSIPTERIIEDPVFKRSDQSYFLQLADCAAFALLKRETTPTAHIKKYAINKMFDEALRGVCFRQASPSDPLGIVRK